MDVIIIGGVLFGTILGRYFKIFVLVPASALAIVLVVASPTSAEQSLWYSILDIGVVVTSLQVGYCLGLLTATTSLLPSTGRSWSQGGPTPASRSYHIR
jgi:hypothetical protein